MSVSRQDHTQAGDDIDYGPVVTSAAKENILGLVESGVNQGVKLVVDGRGFSLQGYEDGFFVGPHLFDNVTPDMDIYKKEILDLFCQRLEPAVTKRLSNSQWIMNMEMVQLFLPEMVTLLEILQQELILAW